MSYRACAAAARCRRPHSLPLTKIVMGAGERAIALRPVARYEPAANAPLDALPATLDVILLDGGDYLTDARSPRSRRAPRPTDSGKRPTSVGRARRYQPSGRRPAAAARRRGRHRSGGQQQTRLTRSSCSPGTPAAGSPPPVSAVTQPPRPARHLTRGESRVRYRRVALPTVTCASIVDADAGDPVLRCCANPTPLRIGISKCSCSLDDRTAAERRRGKGFCLGTWAWVGRGTQP